MKEITVLKCKLKEETPTGTYVNLRARSHDQEFEIRNPGEGVAHNVKKLCDVEVVTMVIPDEIEKSKLSEKQSQDNTKLNQFSMDCWDLAVSLKEKNDDLEAQIVVLKQKTSKKEPSAKQRKSRSK